MPKLFDVIIIGGSIAGLSAALTLARSLRNILVIDKGTPCNMQTPRSHNFITRDGKTPSEIIEIAKSEILKYSTVTFVTEEATKIHTVDEGFIVETNSHKYKGNKILLATGLNDVTPEIPGFAECWGISILHCPYCHGYEVKGKKTVVFANGEAAYNLGMLINNWTSEITAVTNGISELRNEEAEKLKDLNISVIENEVEEFIHTNGKLEKIKFKDGTYFPITVMYASVPFEQQNNLAEKLGCKFTPEGHIDIDSEQRTSLSGIFAAGDCTSQHRAISVASASGTRAGFTINADLVLQ